MVCAFPPWKKNIVGLQTAFRSPRLQAAISPESPRRFYYIHDLSVRYACCVVSCSERRQIRESSNQVDLRCRRARWLFN